MQNQRLDGGSILKARAGAASALETGTAEARGTYLAFAAPLARDHDLARSDRERLAKALYKRVATCNNRTNAEGTCQTCTADLKLLEEIYSEKYSAAQGDVAR